MTPIRSALVVDTNRNSDVLTRREFVWPIQRALPVPSQVIPLSQLKKSTLEKLDLDMLVFSGCTLKDNAYLKYASKLAWLSSVRKPVLGICAGQHLLAAAHGAKTHAMNEPAIGVHPVRVTQAHPLLEDFAPKFNAYFLHGNEVGLPKGFHSIAKSAFSKNDVMVHGQKPVVGVSFHPEVLNKSFFAAFVEWAQN